MPEPIGELILERLERPILYGKAERIGQLGENELKVWVIYQDFLNSIDLTQIEPSNAVVVAALLAVATVSGLGR